MPRILIIIFTSIFLANAKENLTAEAQTNRSEKAPIKVAVLSKHKKSMPNTSQGLYISKLRKAGFETQQISAKEIRNNELADYDIFIIGGGTASSFTKYLGKDGGKAVEKFVRDGGGVIASCAGAYVFSKGYSETTKNIEIANIECLNMKNSGLD